MPIVETSAGDRLLTHGFDVDRRVCPPLRAGQILHSQLSKFFEAPDGSKLGDNVAPTEPTALYGLNEDRRGPVKER